MMMMRLIIKIIVIIFMFNVADLKADVWEKDMSEEIYIEASTDGFEKIKLECDDNQMKVEIVMEDDFEGIIYTRGSFMKKPKDCFYDAEDGPEHSLSIPLDKCDIKIDEEGYHTQTLIIQHDDWLIFPGDLAFTIQCKPQENQDSKVKISLADPDPSAKELPSHRKSTIEGDKVVIFTPADVRPRKNKRRLEAKKSNDEL